LANFIYLAFLSRQILRVRISGMPNYTDQQHAADWKGAVRMMLLLRLNEAGK
jgi:hypothetical protein